MDKNKYAKLEPMNLSELLPQLGMIDKSQAHRLTLSTTKKPRPTMANTSTAGKIPKPMTIAEIQAGLPWSRVKSPKRNAQAQASDKKRWNSSCKLENKTVSHTANGPSKYHCVRKVLNFQPAKPKATKSSTSLRMTMINPATSQFLKPEIKAKKSIQAQKKNRISGICEIPETPDTQNKPMKNRKTLNKENIPNNIIKNKKLMATPISVLRKRLLASRIPDTPISDSETRQSSGDDSFLLHEEKVENIQDLKEQIFENIAVITSTASKPFRDLSHINYSLDSSSHAEESTCHDDTIMTFPNSETKENKAEESIILLLCDKLNKATVSNTERQNIKLEDLLEERNRIKENIIMIGNNIQVLTNFKESQMKSLELVEKLIVEKNSQWNSKNENDETEIKSAKEPPKVSNIIISEPGSVIKKIVKSPLYKIPSKNAHMRKKKSLSPATKMSEEALTMYLKIKECNNYLTTPCAKKNSGQTEVPDTPSIISRNLQNQLNKLYDD